VSARRDNRADRVRFAEDRVAAIEPQLSRLTLTVPPEADAPDLEIRLDGAVIAPAARGVPTAVDPGRHKVDARAPKKAPWSRDVEVGKAGDQQTVTIPKLQDAPEAQSANAHPLPIAAGMGEPSRDTGVKNRPIPTAVYIAGGATLAVGAATVITGALYLRNRSNYISNSTNKPSSTNLEHDRSVAQTVGYVNLALFGATLGGAALTVYLYSTRPEAKSTGISATLVPYAEPTGAGLSMAGGF
jgi:hypothetical protein